MGFYPCRNKHANIGIHGEISIRLIKEHSKKGITVIVMTIHERIVTYLLTEWQLRRKYWKGHVTVLVKWRRALRHILQFIISVFLSGERLVLLTSGRMNSSPTWGEKWIRLIHINPCLQMTFNILTWTLVSWSSLIN